MRGVVCVAIAVLCVGGGALAQSWREFVSREDRFSINFPADPRVETIVYSAANRTGLPGRLYSVEQGATRYTVTVVSFAGRPAAERGAMAHAVATLRARGEVQYEVPNDLDGIFGRQVSVVEPDGRRMQAAIYLYNRRLYIIETNAAPGASPSGQLQQSINMVHPDGRIVDAEREAILSHAWRNQR